MSGFTNLDGWFASAFTETTNLVEEAEDWRKNLDTSTATPAELAHMLFQIIHIYKSMDALTKRLYHVMDAIDKAILPEKLEEHGLDLIRVPELGRSFSIRNMSSASIVDREKAFEWLREIGQEDIIQETVNAGTLTAFCRNLAIDEGIDPPEEAIRVNSYRKISVTKYTPK